MATEIHPKRSVAVRQRTLGEDRLTRGRAVAGERLLHARAPVTTAMKGRAIRSQGLFVGRERAAAEAFYVPWDEIIMILVSGQSGGGKSNSMLHWALQIMMMRIP